MSVTVDFAVARCREADAKGGGRCEGGFLEGRGLHVLLPAGPRAGAVGLLPGVMCARKAPYV